MKLDIVKQSKEEVIKERKARAAQYRAWCVENYDDISRESLVRMFGADLFEIHYEATGERLSTDPKFVNQSEPIVNQETDTVNHDVNQSEKAVNPVET